MSYMKKPDYASKSPRMFLVYKITLRFPYVSELFSGIFQQIFFGNKIIILNYHLCELLLNLLCYFHMVCVM